MDFRKCLLRGYESEPLIRYAAVLEDGSIAVKSEKSYEDLVNRGNQGDWIGWPIEDVYEFNEQALNELKDLWDGGSDVDLEARWEQCQRFSFETATRP